MSGSGGIFRLRTIPYPPSPDPGYSVCLQVPPVLFLLKLLTFNGRSGEGLLRGARPLIGTRH